MKVQIWHWEHCGKFAIEVDGIPEVTITMGKPDQGAGACAGQWSVIAATCYVGLGNYVDNVIKVVRRVERKVLKRKGLGGASRR